MQEVEAAEASYQAAVRLSLVIKTAVSMQELEAAKAFDRAAIRLRGNRAKLNYSLHEYLDEHGNLIEDQRLTVSLGLAGLAHQGL